MYQFASATAVLPNKQLKAQWRTTTRPRASGRLARRLHWSQLDSPTAGWGLINTGVSSTPLHVSLMVQQIAWGYRHEDDRRPRESKHQWTSHFEPVACLLTVHWPKWVIWLSPASTAMVNQATHWGEALQSHVAKGTDETTDENRGHLCELLEVRMDLNSFLEKERKGKNSKCHRCLHPFGLRKKCSQLATPS